VEIYYFFIWQAVHNVSSQSWSGNPREYTIGGVLSGAPEIEHYFKQVLSVSLFIYKNIM